MNCDYNYWNLFWNAFGAIGGTVGALATTAAVIVALWQTKYNQKKKLKLSFSNDIKAVANNTSQIYPYIGINVSNIGNRNVVLSSWGFDMKRNRKVLILPDDSPIGRVLTVQFPYKLGIEEEVTLTYQKEKFLDLLRDSVDKGELSKRQKLVFYVMDSTGKRYTVHTPNTVNDYLEKAVLK